MMLISLTFTHLQYRIINPFHNTQSFSHCDQSNPQSSKICNHDLLFLNDLLLLSQTLNTIYQYIINVVQTLRVINGQSWLQARWSSRFTLFHRQSSLFHFPYSSSFFYIFIYTESSIIIPWYFPLASFFFDVYNIKTRPKTLIVLPIFQKFCWSYLHFEV